MIKAYKLVCYEVQMIGIVLQYPFNVFTLSTFFFWKLLVMARSPTWHEVHIRKAMRVIHHNYILTVHCLSCNKLLLT